MLADVIHAKSKPKIPVVFSRKEVMEVINLLDGQKQLIAKVLLKKLLDFMLTRIKNYALCLIYVILVISEYYQKVFYLPYSSLKSLFVI